MQTFSNRADPKLSTEEVNAQLVDTSTVIEDMSTHEVDENSTHRINNTEYCKCGHCKPMTSVEESVCCKERKIGVHIMGGMVMQFICAIYLKLQLRQLWTVFVVMTWCDPF